MKLSNLTINHNATLREALVFIDKNKKKFLICINKRNKVLGILTDGDLRRAVLNNISLNDSIKKIYNKEYKFLYLTSSFDEVSELFKSKKIDFLPILDEKRKVINVITKKQFHILLLEDIRFDLSFDFSNFKDTKLEHEIYNRPWGFYKSTMLTKHAQAKVITVFPKEELSLQEHKQREEHWVIIKGKGKVVLGDSIIDAYPGKYIYIPKGCKHQIINYSKNNLIFAEVQLGDYFGEDDIIRYSDRYGRVK